MNVSNSLSGVQLFVTPWTVAQHSSLSIEVSRQEYWSGLPFPSLGNLSDPGIKPRSPALLTTELPGKPNERRYGQTTDHKKKSFVIISYQSNADSKHEDYHYISICCCCSVAQSCPTFCSPMDCSMPGFHVPHHLPEFA